MRGAGDAPDWAVILLAAGCDPLRAQQIDADLSAEWWYRWNDMREAAFANEKSWPLH